MEGLFGGASAAVRTALHDGHGPALELPCHHWHMGAGPGENPRSAYTVATAAESVDAWTFVVYGERHRTVTYVSSKDLPGAEWHTVYLPPGRYKIVARYYGCGEDVVFPAISVDGRERTGETPVNGEGAAYQSCLLQIANKKGAFYRALQYYVYPMLQWRDYLLDSFVERNYLPVGQSRHVPLFTER